MGQLCSVYFTVSTVLASLSCGTQTLSCGRGRRIQEERTHVSVWCSEYTSLNPMGRCCRYRLRLFLWNVVSVSHTLRHSSKTYAFRYPFMVQTHTHKLHTQISKLAVWSFRVLKCKCTQLCLYLYHSSAKHSSVGKTQC